MCMCLCMQSVHCERRCAIRIQKRTLDALELKWQVMWVTWHGCWEPVGSSARAVYALPCWSISPARVFHLQQAPSSISSLCNKWRNLLLVSQCWMLKTTFSWEQCPLLQGSPFSTCLSLWVVFLCSHLSESSKALGPLTFPWLDKLVILLPLSRGLACGPVVEADDTGSGWWARERHGRIYSLDLQSQSSALHWFPFSSLLSIKFAKMITKFLVVKKLRSMDNF